MQWKESDGCMCWGEGRGGVCGSRRRRGGSCKGKNLMGVGVWVRVGVEYRLRVKEKARRKLQKKNLMGIGIG